MSRILSGCLQYVEAKPSRRSAATAGSTEIRMRWCYDSQCIQDETYLLKKFHNQPEEISENEFISTSNRRHEITKSKCSSMLLSVWELVQRGKQNSDHVEREGECKKLEVNETQSVIIINLDRLY